MYRWFSIQKNPRSKAMELDSNPQVLTMDPTYPLAPIINFLSAILALLPLFTNQLYSGTQNIAVVAFAIWTSVECVTTGINSIIWSDNVNNLAPIWCDISMSSNSQASSGSGLWLPKLLIATHIDAASNVAIRGCTLSIVRRLYHATREGRNDYYMVPYFWVPLTTSMLTTFLEPN